MASAATLPSSCSSQPSGRRKRYRPPARCGGQVDLLTRAQTSEIRLQPLSFDEVNRYLDLQLGTDVSRQSAAALYRVTRGNPLFLVTAIDHLVRSGHVSERGEGWHLEVSPTALEAAIPASLVGTVARALEELAPDERQAIDAASVVGVEFSLWLAAHAANIDELALEPVLEVLARRRTLIVREGVVELANGVFSPLYRFTHGLYQEIVLDHTPAKGRVDAHARAGAGDGARVRWARARGRRRPGVSFPFRRRPPARGALSPHGSRKRHSSAMRRAKPRRSCTAP